MNGGRPGLRLPAVPFSELIRDGDGIIWGQGLGQPRTLIEALRAAANGLPNLTLFSGYLTDGVIEPPLPDNLRLRSYGAMGALRRHAAAGTLDLLPCHMSQIPGLIAQGHIQTSVTLVQVAPAGPDGRHSLGIGVQYLPYAIANARIVIAEINDRLPDVPGPNRLAPTRMAFAVHVSRQMPEWPTRELSPVDIAIANHVVSLIDDGATLQLGIGAVPNAVLGRLHSARNLGVHSGFITDGIWSLIERGVVTNARKPFDRGITIAGAAFGTEPFYRWLDRNPAVELHATAHTHGLDVLARLPAFFSLNSALEVDLLGQVNAETLNGAVVGGVGGQLDYVRGAAASEGGRSVIALPSTGASGTRSRIVAQLSGTVTTPASDVDWVITEYGRAQLRGLTSEQRRNALIQLAHPKFRDALTQGRLETAPR